MPTPYGKRLKMRRDQGFTWLKMDLGIDLLGETPGTLTHPLGQTGRDTFNTQHMFTGIEITDKGVAMMADYVGQVREIIGMEVPLAADHFGHIGVNSCIKLGKALQKYNMAWLEDMIPWQYTDLWKKITDAIDVPTLTGEDIYLKEPFIELARNHAVDILHPDLATSGGILETKKIGDAIGELGVGMAMHFAGTPVSCMANVHCAAATENFLVLENHSVDVPWWSANVHCAAATENFLVLENHSVDVPWWSDLVNGVEKPIVNKGFVTVPSGPGLGITLNDEVVKQHLLEPGYFEPTPEWNKERSHDRLWS